MWVHWRLVRLRGDLSCVQIIVVIPAHFACWTTLDHSHEVDGHFMPPLCILMRSNAPSSHLFADFLSCPRPTYIHTLHTPRPTSIHPSVHPSIHPSIHHPKQHTFMHLEQQPWLCMAICIPSSMFWVAGGFSSYSTNV